MSKNEHAFNKKKEKVTELVFKIKNYNMYG